MRDLPQMQKIYARARALMAANGNPTQWGNEFPRESMIEEMCIRDRLAAGAEAAKHFVDHTQIFTLAESLGGVESLIEVPAAMTHASVAGTCLLYTSSSWQWRSSSASRSLSAVRKMTSRLRPATNMPTP